MRLPEPPPGIGVPDGNIDVGVGVGFGFAVGVGIGVAVGVDTGVAVGVDVGPAKAAFATTRNAPIRSAKINVNWVALIPTALIANEFAIHAQFRRNGVKISPSIPECCEISFFVCA